MARNRRFVDSFWESDFNGTLGYDHICKRLRDGNKTCKDIEDFLRKRAKAELQYSKTLQGLTKSTDCRDETGNLEDGWLALRKHTETLAQIHDTAFKDFSKFADETSRFADNQKIKVKQSEDKVKEGQKQKRSAYHKTMDAQKTYHTKCRDMNIHKEQYTVRKQIMETSTRDIEKLKTRAEKSFDAMEQADSTYKQTVEILEKNRSMWEYDMIESCELFQSMEEERISFLRDVMWTCSNVDSTSSAQCDDSCEEIRVTLERCDVSDDIQSFIEHHMTGSIHPVPIKYEGYFDDKPTPTKGSSPRPVRRPPPPAPTLDLPPLPGNTNTLYTSIDYSMIESKATHQTNNSSLYYSTAEEADIYSLAKDVTTKYKVTKNYLPEVLQGVLVRRGDTVQMLEAENKKGMIKVQIDTTGAIGMVPMDHLQRI